MLNEIKCPNCGTPFQMEEAVAKEYKKELRGKMEEFVRSKNEEFRQKEEQFLQKEKELQQQTRQQEDLLREKEKLWQEASRQKEAQLKEQAELEKKQFAQQMEENMRRNIAADFENRITLLQQEKTENEERLKEARKQQLEFMQKEEALRRKEEELEISVQKKLQEERSRIAEDIRQLEEQKNAARETEFQLRLKELEKQLDDQKKLAEEMKRRAEQGSMQLQGEIQELALEALLRATHPFDLVEEVGKGVRGADCIQVVRNNIGQECGRIIYESKRTKDFSNDWIEKLKSDMRSLKADIAIIVTQAMPKEMEGFGEKDGVWICNFHEIRSVSSLVRDGILRVAQAARSQENKGDKMHMLYDYLTSNEFAEQWKAIREGFLSMKMSIQKERDTMEKLWKAREKQLEKVLLNAAHFKGSIEGIAGQDIIDLKLLEEPEDENGE
ncbi:MAG: DUF2130 domain-containing protein [Chitinophagaceae bacterium]